MAQIDQDSLPELKQMFTSLLKATKRAELKEIVRTLGEKYNGTWRLVGDRENYPTVHMASSPVSSIIERITNAIDAQLEAIALYSSEMVKDCESPRKLVEKRYQVVGGYLTSLGDIRNKRERLVDDAGISITAKDGDAEDTPTIDVADAGIGVAKDEFPDTLLSLNRSNKISKWYLMGRFGQGGSATYRFSEYTVMISRRRRSVNDLDNSIPFTIIKYQEARKGEKDGRYVYLVRKDDNLPFSIPADGIGFGGGTLVRHVNYELGKKYLLDLYGHMETFLFDPVLPFWLREERSWETNRGQGRRIFGSRDRLSRTDSVEAKDEFVAHLDHGDLGDVIVRYWVFKRGTQTKEKLTFIDPDEPIVVTYLGQTHAKLPRRILANDCRLPNLHKDLVVQIDCDSITDKGRRIMFTSTREVITEEGRRLLKDALMNTLTDELSELDQKRQLEFLSEGVTKAKDDLRRKLAEMINRIKPGTVGMPSGSSGSKGSKRRTKRRSRRSKPPLPTKNFPTYIKVGNKEDPLKFSKAWIGTWIEVESDAPDNFLSESEAVLELSEETQKIAHVVVKHKDFRGGRLYIKVGLVGEPTIGLEFTFGIRMRAPTPNNVCEFTDSRKAIVVEAQKGGEEKKTPLDAPNIWEVKPNDSFWVENEWTDENVGEVREGNSVDIYVSFGNKWLVGALMRSKYTSTAQEVMKSKYLLHMAFYAYLQNKGLYNLTKNENKGESLTPAHDISEELLEKIRRDSLEWAARSILTAITSGQAFSKTDDMAGEIETD